MSTQIKYIFFHNESSGIIYESDRFGLVVIFDGFLKFGEPFYIKNRDGESVEGEEKRDLIEALTGIISESVKNA